MIDSLYRSFELFAEKYLSSEEEEKEKNDLWDGIFISSDENMFPML